jgi:hypothetical protein
MLEALGEEPLWSDEIFLEELTLGRYLDLSEERAHLWEAWAREDWETSEEVDVRLDAVPAG